MICLIHWAVLRTRGHIANGLGSLLHCRAEADHQDGAHHDSCVLVGLSIDILPRAFMEVSLFAASPSEARAERMHIIYRYDMNPL